MGEKRYLVKLNANWADEFDYDGHMICDSEEVEMIKKAFEENGTIEVGIGTNEDAEVSINDFEFKEITDEEIQMLEKLELNARGFCTVIRQVMNKCTEDSFEDADSED